MSQQAKRKHVEEEEATDDEQSFSLTESDEESQSKGSNSQQKGETKARKKLKKSTLPIFIANISFSPKEIAYLENNEPGSLQKQYLGEIMKACASLEVFESTIVPKHGQNKQVTSTFISAHHSDIVQHVLPLLIRTKSNLPSKLPTKIPKPKDTNRQLLERCSLIKMPVNEDSKVALFIEQEGNISYIGWGILKSIENEDVHIEFRELVGDVTESTFEVGETALFKPGLVCDFHQYCPIPLSAQDLLKKKPKKLTTTLASLDNQHATLPSSNLEQTIKELEEIVKQKERDNSLLRSANEELQTENTRLRSENTKLQKEHCIPSTFNENEQKHYKALKKKFATIGSLLKKAQAEIDEDKTLSEQALIKWRDEEKFVARSKMTDVLKNQSLVAITAMLNLLIETFGILDKSKRYIMPKNTNEKAEGNIERLTTTFVADLITSISFSCTRLTVDQIRNNLGSALGGVCGLDIKTKSK